MRSYKPDQLFTEEGKLIPELKELPPKGNKRMSANPITNGGTIPGRFSQMGDQGDETRDFDGAVHEHVRRVDGGHHEEEPDQLPPDGS
ncbi:hypothetical protein LTR02_018357 [Friedmanniomyces endolithicus]|nr:hypothetical protein LTR94_037530 [Friedmanniomyces endolithicus]KAK0767283.1 hypothetical protein LTR38_018389 [Friedmanniomyces endolithicus]KAK0878622.1 hypothetical protein LTR02_018357 [Friedmanniomyces endolithicus]KAK0941120.1 hypothetical protein LTS01_026127 [Friedmanniomyces endolithicus]